MFRFCGVFSEAGLSGQRRQLAARLEALQIAPQQRAHALAIFVELAQNIIRYGAAGSGKDLGSSPRALLQINLRGNRLDFFAGNYLAAPAADRFRQHMAQFDQLDKTGWRALWQGQMQKPRQAGQEGGGLGLMELARRSGSLPGWRLSGAADGQLAYCILPVNHRLSRGPRLRLLEDFGKGQ